MRICLLMQGARVPSLVRELRSHMLLGVATKKQKTKNPENRERENFNIYKIIRRN